MSWQDPPPDPTNPDLLDNLRAYLVSLGIVRNPRDASKQWQLPVMWLSPRFGVPAPWDSKKGTQEGLNPIESESLLVGVFDATDTPPPPFEGFRRIAHVELVYRGRTPTPVKRLENKIRAAINDKRGWMMGNVPVNESLLFRGLQPVGSDNLGWVYNQEYTFELWGPFTPVGP